MVTWRILQGDVCDRLASLPAESVQTCVTSPPYWGLRDYGHAGQIGLEPTPAEYVTRMVEVFAEVHRVLRKDGTLWLNLGASYASAPVETFKHKDLVSIPAMVAEALRAPRYTGRIKSDRDRLWLAAMVDTEGCIHVHRRRAGTSAHSTYTKRDGTVSEYVRKADTYGVMVSVDNTSRALIDRCAEVAGVGSLYTHEANTGQSQRKQTLHRWTVTGGQARELLRELYPDLIAKRQQARIAYHSPSNGDAAAEAHAAIKSLHAGVGVTLDAPEPPSLFVPGWYLRSEIIWGKPNPMPESVTDRPTKSHEQIFLFSKSARYYYDAEAIKEDGSGRASGKHTPDKTGAGAGFEVRAGFAKVGDVEWHARNKRSVWTVATQPYPEAHFATYPEALIEPCILAGTSERGQCPACGAPWERVVERDDDGTREYSSGRAVAMGHDHRGPTAVARAGEPKTTRTLGWQPSCACDAGDPVPQLVLDPFTGSGTTGAVAIRHQRSFVGTELNPAYIDLARRRIGDVAPLLASEVV